ncbi:MAG: caspase family protein, partial [Gemmataceae bacterium]|nr:caspase family protein [Gemmataceae bacterium]
MSVVVAKDASWFVTGASDQTVAAWSLKDWKGQSILGAAFQEKNGALVVESVDTGSPAWEAGLIAGAVIDLLKVDLATKYDRRAGAAVGTPADALRSLEAPRAGLELYFGVAARGKSPRYETLTTVRQRPLWKWFPTVGPDDNLADWVVWMWHGSYYHTKTANGDRLAGWHVNHPTAGGQPAFCQLQQLEKHFHRPDVLETVVATRDVGAALVAARGAEPVKVPFTQFEPAPVRLRLSQSDVPAAGLPVTLSVSAGGTNPDLFVARVELWLNDHLAGLWPQPGALIDGTKPFDVRHTLPADQFRSGENRLAVLAFNAAGGRSEDAVVVSNPRAPGAATLHAVLTGVKDYAAVRKAAARDFRDLATAPDDARALGAEFEKFAGAKLAFRDAAVKLELDPPRARLAKTLGEVAARAKPDDTLVVFFAGHGDLLLPADAALPKDGLPVLGSRGVFLLCCPEYSPAAADKTALPVEELFRELARINCRKVVLLDVCRSERAAAASVLRRCVPTGQGPV